MSLLHPFTWFGKRKGPMNALQLLNEAGTLFNRDNLPVMSISGNTKQALLEVAKDGRKFRILCKSRDDAAEVTVSEDINGYNFAEKNTFTAKTIDDMRMAVTSVKVCLH